MLTGRIGRITAEIARTALFPHILIPFLSASALRASNALRLAKIPPKGMMQPRSHESLALNEAFCSRTDLNRYAVQMKPKTKAERTDRPIMTGPRKTVNGRTTEDSIDEYLILEKAKGENKPSLLRNDYGKLVEHKTTSERWKILDKFKFHEEETFWVYGYDPRASRKTFMWIYKNLLVNQISGRYDIKRVALYNNKLVIKDDYANMDLVICKTRSDAIRFYNLLQDYATKEKHSQIYFMGAYAGNSHRTSKLINEIIELTGWDRRKITRISTNT